VEKELAEDELPDSGEAGGVLGFCGAMRRFFALTPVCAVLLCTTFSRADDPRPDRAAWMADARFGVMNHYLEDWIARREKLEGGRMTVEQWNDMVDRFDVAAHVSQIESTGAKYHIFTIGQNSGFYVSPNATYDRIVGISPSHCSRRDLIADLSDALHARGIKLIVYLPSGAPGGDAVAREKLQWHGGGANANREFQRNWEAVIREWSTRWGRKIDGWWYDGCYWPNTMYRSKEPPNFESFAAASRAGNPDGVVAFNPGVVYRTISITPYEDYIAGEVDQPERWTPRRNADGKQDGTRIQMLSYLGDRWGFGETPRFSTEQAVAFSRKVFDAGGAVTWDVPIGRDGTIARPFLDQLTAIGTALRNAAATRTTTRSTTRSALNSPPPAGRTGE
jgi:alpha-L-fucosidase